MSHDELVQIIRSHAKRGSESQQIAKRLRTLLVPRLRQLIREKTGLHTYSRAERLAYTDPIYQNHIEEYAQILGTALESRITYETHMMLVEARRSLRYSHNRRLRS